MYVILDTSSIIKDYYFGSPKFITLFEYLRKTAHNLILPKIVLEELKKNHTEELEKLVSGLEKISNDHLSLLRSKQNFNKFDVQKEAKLYSKFLDEFVEDRDIIVPKYNPKHLEQIAIRAVLRKPPFVKGSKNDHGFKDAVIWETVKDILSDTDYNFVAFISNNTHQFADSSKKNLHPELESEIELYKEKFGYFPNIESFLETYGGEKISHISQEALQAALNMDLADKVEKNLFSKEFLKTMFENRLRLPTDEIFFEDAKIDNFYISKATQSNYYVEAIGRAEAWVVYFNPLDSTAFTDTVSTRFNASFKVSKSSKTVTIEDFLLERAGEYSDDF